VTLRYTVGPDKAGSTLQSLCRTALRLSAAQLRRAKQKQGLLVNGSPAFASRPLCAGDLVQVELWEEPPAYPPEPGGLRILYEDELMLAVNKPQGVIVHPTHSRLTGTLANRVWAYLQAGGSDGCHAVDRLDRDTGGVILFAKNAWACRLLGDALAEEETEKLYLAAVLGVPSPPMGRIDLPIRRPDPRDLRREAGGPGDPASTAYTLLESRDGISLLRLRLYTGRTHQIRVHCAAMGWPLLGDRLYGTPESLARSEDMGQSMQALHCCALRLRHPLTGESLRLESKPNWPALKIFSIMS
jgi:RluA family pseudouridine synthase